MDAGAPDTTEYRPAKQSTHTEEVEEPTVVENFPARQSAHTLDPEFALNLPAGQDVQAEEPKPENMPEAQFVHVNDATAPKTMEYEPATQLMQLDKDGAPEAFKYVPAGQEAQLDAPDDTWYCPAAQLAHPPCPLFA